MDQLIVLGTGNARAINCYNTCYAMKKNDEYFLVDAGGGNGILSALENAHIPIKNIHHLFVSHAHTDHILGVIWLIRLVGTFMNNGTYDGDFHIYCHKELVDTIKTLTTLTVRKKFYKYFDDRMLFHIVEHGETKTILGDKFIFFDIESTKDKQFGFSVNMDNGIKLTFVGDEPYRDNLHQFVQGSDWMLHEAFCLYSQRDRFRPYEKHHSTVKDACQLAQSLNIPNLVLWHTEDHDMAHRQENYLKEGQKYYSGNLLIPEDQDVIVF